MAAARELDVYGLVEGETVNVALTGTVTSGGTGTTNPAGREVPINPTRSNDGAKDADTVRQAYSHGAGTVTSWWQIELAAATEVSAFLLHRNTNPGGISWEDHDVVTLWGSANGTDWTEIDYTEVHTVGPPEFWTLTFDAPQTFLHFRILETSVHAGLGFQVGTGFAEWDVMGVATVELTFLGTLTSAFNVQFRDELDGHGSLSFQICRYDDPAAGTANPECSIAMLGDAIDVTRLVKVRVRKADGTYKIVGAGWLETGDFTLLSEQEKGAEILTFGGRGSLAYLDRDMLLEQTFVAGGDDPFDGIWRHHAAGCFESPECGESDPEVSPNPVCRKPGQIAYRHLVEMLHADREIGGEPFHAVPLLTHDLDYCTDTDGNTWNASAATKEFSTAVGNRYLSLFGRLLGTGELVFRMRHDLYFGAWNRDAYGTDRTGLAFGAGVVRFAEAVNIRALSRQIAARNRGTHALVKGEGDVYGHATSDPTTRPHWAVFVPAYGVDETALDAIGAADLAQRMQRSEVVRFPFLAGYDPDNGAYTPWEDFEPGDAVTVNTGAHERDLVDVDGVVAAITMADRPGAVPLVVRDVDFWVEVGSTMSVRDAAGSGIVSGGYGGGLTSAVGGGTGLSGPAPAHRLGSHTDTDFDTTPPTDGQAPIWDDASGKWIPGDAGASLTVAEEDGAPSVADVTMIEVPNGSLVDDTGGVVSLRYVLPMLGGVEDYFDHGGAGAAEEIDLASGNGHLLTLDTADCTLSIVNGTDGKLCFALIDLEQTTPAVPGTVTWWSAIDWIGGTEPLLSTGDGEVDTIVVWSTDGFATARGLKVGGGGASDHDDLTNVTADQHHAEDHALRHQAAGADAFTRVWMPLTTVVGGVPELVWDDDDSLIPTEVPI